MNNKLSAMRKRTVGKSSYLSEFGGARSRAYSTSIGRTYNPDLFDFKTEIQYTRILFLLFDCLTNAIEHSDFYNFFSDNDEHIIVHSS